MRVHRLSEWSIAGIAAFCIGWWWPDLLAFSRIEMGRWVAISCLAGLLMAWRIYSKDRWLGLTLAGLSISTAFNMLTNRTALVHGTPQGPTVTFTTSPLLALLTVLALGMVFLIASEIKPSISKRIAKAFVMVGVFSGALSVWQWFGGRWPGIYPGDPMDLGAAPGLFGNPGLQGGILAVLMPLSLAFMPILFPVLLAGLLLSKSSIGVLAATVAIPYMLGSWKFLLTLGLVGLVAFVFLVDRPKGAELERLKVWKATFWLWPRYPKGRLLGDQRLPFSWESATFGWGLSMFSKRFPLWDYRLFRIGLIREEEPETLAGGAHDRTKTGEGVTARGSSWIRTHNEYLQLLFEGGLVSFLPFLAFLAFLGLRLEKAARETRVWAASLLAGLVFALWHFPFQTAASALVLSFATGRLYAKEAT